VFAITHREAGTSPVYGVSRPRRRRLFFRYSEKHILIDDADILKVIKKDGNDIIGLRLLTHSFKKKNKNENEKDSIDHNVCNNSFFRAYDGTDYNAIFNYRTGSRRCDVQSDH
jgi:hypothetical protein